MKNRFYPIVILVILLFGAWTYLSHQKAEILTQNYVELARLPIYAYVADTTLVSPLLEKLAEIPDLDSLRHDTGFQAAEELVTAYNLPLEKGMIAGYDFPDVITITFPPSDKGIAAKTAVMALLYERLPEEDIDSQKSAYDRLLQHLKQNRASWLGYSVLIALLMLRLLMAIRMSFEQRQYHRQARKSRSIVDMMRLKKSRAKRTLLITILPPALAIAFYYAVGFFKLWESYNLWWNFLMMGLVSILGSLAYYFEFRSYEQEDLLSLPEPATPPVHSPEVRDA